MRQPMLFSTLRHYSKSAFLADLLAGTTVAMVAIPLSLAIAIASGADPATGLFTAIIGGFLISLFGGSTVQIGGPTGAFIVVVYGVIADHGYDGLVLATFMAGIILMIGGYFRAGRLISFVPEAVVHGFTIGIGVIIGTSQLKDFLGLTADNVPADFIDKLEALWAVRDTLNLTAFGIAFATLVLIVLLRRLLPKFPGLIVAVAIGSAATAWFGLPVDTIGSRFGELPSSLPVPGLPDFSVDRITELFPSAIIIAFLAGVESLLSAMVADKMIEGNHRPNAELTAQGIANVATGFLGGFTTFSTFAKDTHSLWTTGLTTQAILQITLSILLGLAAVFLGIKLTDAS